jgi:hypothetical protein
MSCLCPFTSPEYWNNSTWYFQTQASFDHFIGIYGNLGRFQEIEPLSEPRMFLFRWYFYKPDFDFCDLKIDHLVSAGDI